MKKLSLDDLSQWVDNDETLYNWWKASRRAKRDFIRIWRDDITQYIHNRLSQKPR